MPRFSDSTRPASLSFAMWCEMVGWVSSRPAVKSQMEMGASAFHSDAIMVSRVGSASAFIRSEVWFAHLALTLGSSQHAPRSRSTGSSLIAMTALYATHRQMSMGVIGFNPSKFIDQRSPQMSDVKEAVRTRYAGVARQLAVLQPDANTGCCQADGPDCGCSGSYSAAELKEIGLSESVSLGCGNPTMLAQLEPGQVVLDLGSGAGLDVLLSARRVAPSGHAYGVDMTDEMLQLANDNKKKAGVGNATFLKGSIESVPLPDASVDVVISNCVINLAEDKGAVINEAFRVLRPGGLFAVADMVELEPLAPDLKQRLDAWAGCISGTIPIDVYRGALLSAGFDDPDVQVHATESMPGVDGKVGSAYIRARKPAG